MILKILKRINNLKYLPLFLKNLHLFLKSNGKITGLKIIISDFSEPSGVMSGHYFHSDLLISQYIFENSPKNHLDVASRSDGLVAHVASFRVINFLDIRDHELNSYPNLIPIKADICNKLSTIFDERFDSISCSYALANFGFGRYGDIVDPNAHLTGFRNMVTLLEKGGYLYISIPLSSTNEIIYNSHRSFRAMEPLYWDDRVRLIKFSFVDENGSIHKDVNPEIVSTNIGALSCGIYTFERF
jgi:hypothetical protein